MNRRFIFCQKLIIRNTYKQWLPCATVLLCAYLPANIFAQQVDGVFTKFAQSNDFANSWINDVKVESNGLITVVGHYQGLPDASNKPAKAPMLLRLNSNGTIKTDFGEYIGGGSLLDYIKSSNGSNSIKKVQSSSNGTFILAGQFDNDEVGYITKTNESDARPTQFNSAAPILPDGPGVKSYVEEMIFNGTSSFWVARHSGINVVVELYNATTGQLMPTFGTAGKTVLPNPPNHTGGGNGIKMLRMPDGGFYVAYTTGTYLSVCKLLANGQLDNNFLDFGHADFPSSLVVGSLAVKANGDVVVGGEGYNGPAQLPSTGYIVFRTNEALQLVSNPPQFPLGSAMVTSTPATTPTDPIRIVAGKKIVNGKPHIFIQKFNPDNDADQLTVTPWLGKNGISAIPTSIAKYYSSGYIVAGNMIGEQEDTVGVVLKYNLDGTLDQSFGEKGVCYINAIQSGQGWADVAHFPDGKYLAAGTATYMPNDLHKKAIVLNKFLVTGDPDSSFGENGRLYAQLSTNNRTAERLHAYSNGSFLIFGTVQNGLYNNSNIPAVYKFLPNGSLDSSFGVNGVRFIGNLSATASNDFLVTDSIIYVGGSNGASAKSQLTKLSPNGTMVTSVLMGSRNFDCMGINPISGSMFIGTGYNAQGNVIYKSMVDGTIDSDFGPSGYALLTAIPNGANSPCYVKQIKTNEAGIIMVVRHWYESVGLTKPQAVYFNWITPDGRVDSSDFGGTKKLNIPGASSVIPERYQWVENNRKLLIFGQAIVNGVAKGMIAKVNTSGDLDPDFGTNGIIWANTTFGLPFNLSLGGDIIKITNNGLLGGSYLSKLEVPYSVYQPISSAGWTGAISSDWFTAGNWAEGIVPDLFTKVVIASGQCVIPPNSLVYAYSVTVAPGASFTVGENSTLVLTGENP